GTRCATTVHSNGTRTFSQKGRAGYVSHSYSYHGHGFGRRTYSYHGRSYDHFYHSYWYRGGYMDVYAPSFFYGAAYYGWAYNPWGSPVDYNWGWGAAPWYRH